MKVNKATIVTLVCCVLHNFCEIYLEPIPLPEDVDQHLDQFVGVCRGAMRLPDDGRVGKVAGKQMKAAIFQSWVARNPTL